MKEGKTRQRRMYLPHLPFFFIFVCYSFAERLVIRYVFHIYRAKKSRVCDVFGMAETQSRNVLVGTAAQREWMYSPRVGSGRVENFTSHTTIQNNTYIRGEADKPPHNKRTFGLKRPFVPFHDASIIEDQDEGTSLTSKAPLINNRWIWG